MPAIYDEATNTVRSIATRSMINADGAPGRLELLGPDLSTVLASIVLGYPDDATALINGRTITFAGFPRSNLTPVVSGAATMARIVSNTGKPVRTGMTVGLIGTDTHATHAVLLSNKNLVAGEDVLINSMVISNTFTPPPVVIKPVLSEAVLTPQSPTNMGVTIQTDTPNGVLFVLLSVNAFETISSIKSLGQSRSIISTASQTFTFSSLNPDTPYYLHAVQVNAESVESDKYTSTPINTLPEIVIPDPDPELTTPLITTISPTNGLAGAEVTINGLRFGTSGSVAFGSANASIVSWTDTQIKVTAPVGTGSTAVRVTNTGGLSNTANYTYVAVPPPATVTEAMSYAIWPNYVIRSGPNCIDFNTTVKLRWKNVNGDWLDANQVEQGTAAWYTNVFPKGFVGLSEIDITALANRWRTGENRGLTFMARSSNNASAIARFGGTFSANPPRLVISRAGEADVTIVGDMVGFTLTSLTAGSPPSNLDTTQQASMSKANRILVHFKGVNDLVGTITSAKLLLYVNSSHATYPLTMDLFETNPPPLILGGGGLPPVYGLAAEVGEDNLAGHPDVILATDFKEENWNATPGIWTDASLGSGLSFSTQMSKAQYQKTQIIPDPDRPGSHYMRTCIATGQIGGGEFIRSWHKSGTAESGYMPDPAGYEGEIYIRCYIWLEQDSFWSNLYGFKFSPVGMKLSYGKGEPGGRWNGDSIWQYGHGQTPSDGRRVWNSTHNQWILKGHSIRGHMLGFIHPEHNAYPGAMALGIAPSHLGPYDSLRDGGLYGTEQNMRIGVRGRDHCIPMNRWVCIESHCKVNTIDMSVLDSEGNGIARNDGIWEMWLDGVLVGGRYNLAFFRHPSMGIRSNWLMAYHGGNSPTDHDIWWRVKDFVIARKYIGPKV